MRVIHLPSNIASIPSHTIRGLRQIGVEAIGLVWGNSIIQSSDELITFSHTSKSYPIRWVLNRLKLAYFFLKWLHWADVVHWYYGAPILPYGLDLKIIKHLGKASLIEWMGSDIRVPEVEFVENPYYTAVFHNGYEYQHTESLENSRRLQKQFAEANFASAVATGMLQYIQEDITPHPYVISQRIVLSDYQPVYPNIHVTKPVIVHSPSAPIAKGTPTVLKVIEQLKSNYGFEFHLIQGVPRHQALKIVQSADIFLDQFVLGDRGMASLEAMALGKPVICYLKPSLRSQYPSDLPIVNATQDNLIEVLGQLIRDSQLRYDLGCRGRAYVEKYHDAFKVAFQLKEIYSELLNKTKP